MTNELLIRTPEQLIARGKIDAIEGAMLEGVEEGALSPVLHDGATPEGRDECDHFFADGVYVRGVFIPAGTCVIGKLHKQSRVCIVAQGECTFFDEFHHDEVKAPWAGEFKGGSKTAVYAKTDCYWLACTGTDLTDPIEILETLAAKDHDDYAAYVMKQLTGGEA